MIEIVKGWNLLNILDEAEKGSPFYLIIVQKGWENITNLTYYGWFLSSTAVATLIWLSVSALLPPLPCR